MLRAFYEFFCFHRKNLLYTLVWRNLAVKYRGSVLGFLWTLLIPLAQVIVFYLVYKVILNLPVPNYLAVVVTGILPWIFFTSTVNESFDALVSSQGLLTNVPIPIQVFPASAAITHFINFGLSSPALLLVILCSKVPLSGLALLFIPYSLLLFIFSYSLAFIFASLFVEFRDLKHLFGILVQLWFYVTPIFYTVDLIPEHLRWGLYLNPIAGYFVAIRDVLVFDRWPEPGLALAFFGWTLATFLLANVLRYFLGARLVEKI